MLRLAYEERARAHLDHIKNVAHQEWGAAENAEYHRVSALTDALLSISAAIAEAARLKERA
jgi:plasmid stabilization system protein ParE